MNKGVWPLRSSSSFLLFFDVFPFSFGRLHRTLAGHKVLSVYPKLPSIHPGSSPELDPSGVVADCVVPSTVLLVEYASVGLVP